MVTTSIVAIAVISQDNVFDSIQHCFLQNSIHLLGWETLHGNIWPPMSLGMSHRELWVKVQDFSDLILQIQSHGEPSFWTPLGYHVIILSIGRCSHQSCRPAELHGTSPGVDLL